MFILKLQHYGGIKLSFSEPPNCQIVNGTKQKNRKRNHRVEDHHKKQHHHLDHGTPFLQIHFLFQ